VYHLGLESGARDLILIRSRSLFSIAFLWLGLIGTASAASVLEFDPLSPEEILLAQRAIADSATAVTPADPAAPRSTPALDVPSKVTDGGRKKPGLGVLYSLVLPGAGHLYAGKARGFAHIGVDVVSWAAYAFYRDAGKSKENEFQNYADAHWDHSKWLASGCSECFAGSDADKLIQNFHANNKQQYYEDIGKISTYFSGWDDYVSAPDPQTTSDNRNFYRGMRNQSNNLLRDANYGLVTAMVNRVVSAVDVFRILHKRALNSLGENTKLRIHLRSKPFATDTNIGFEITQLL
jgi:hypothetical protein